MNLIKPVGSPPCWGETYQDGDEECRQCRYNSDCKMSVMEKVNRPGASLPLIRNYAPTTMMPPPAPKLTLPPTSTVVPLPPKPYIVPPVQTKPPVSNPPPPPPVSQQYTAGSNSVGAYSIPNTTTPSPFASWHRPGAPGPAYHFNQYPTEAVSTRLAKNAILRALEAILGELMQFFRHWTWPPK